MKNDEAERKLKEISKRKCEEIQRKIASIERSIDLLRTWHNRGRMFFIGSMIMAVFAFISIGIGSGIGWTVFTVMQLSCLGAQIYCGKKLKSI